MRRMASALHFSTRLIFIANESGRFCLQRFHVRAFDQKVEHNRELAEQDRLQIEKRLVGVSRKEKADHAEKDISEAVDHQPNANPTRQKSGTKDEQTKRKEP